jgi:outer membrane protein
MPEVQKAQKQLYNFIYQAKNELKIMKIQYQQKIYEYNKSKDTLMPIIKNNKIEEIKSLDKRIQNFESEINTEYTKRQKKIDNLINTKINKAIEKVREAENFDIVENITPNILYINPKYDITKKVIKQLQKK